MIVGLVILPQIGWAYDSPSDAELETWWSSLTFTERMDFIRVYDRIEHETPEIDLPDAVILLTDRDVLVSYPGPGEIRIGHLTYGVTIPDVNVPDLLPRGWQTGTWRTTLLASAASLLVGIVGGLIIEYVASGAVTGQTILIGGAMGLTAGVLAGIFVIMFSG